jgi:hypothetical protein
MRRDRSSRCVMSARDVVDHHSSQLKLRKRRRNSSDLLRLSKEDVVRSSVKHVALSSRSDLNSNSSHEVSRSRWSVGPVRLRLSGLRGR